MKTVEVNDVEYVNVPIYIEKAVKKLYKINKNMKEVKAQIKDYMESHDIPLNTPLDLLRNFDEDVNPNQIKMDI